MKKLIIKFGTMRSEQSFTIYPYNGGDTVTIQSNKRIAEVNLRTGLTILSKQVQNGAYFMHLSNMFGAIVVDFPKDELVKLQEYLWNNSGVQEVVKGILLIENKELFSEPKN